MSNEAFQIDEFKRYILDIVGERPDEVKAMELIGDACARAMTLGLKPTAIARVLHQSALKLVFDNETLEEHWHFAKYMERSAQGDQRVVERVYEECDLGPPPTDSEIIRH